MEKLTAEKILEIIEDNMSVEQFAYCDYPVSDSFEESQEVKELRESSEKKWNEIENHPTHEKSWSERDADAEYQKLRNEYNNIPKYYDVHEENWLKHLGLGRVEEVEQYGGEDQGSTWYSIKHFVDHDVYIKTDGYYSSYNGTDFYEGHGYEVLPTKVEVIQYQAAPVVIDTEDEILTADELIQKLTNRIDKDDFGETGYSTVDEDLFGPNKLVDSVGNHEGAGSHAHTVRYFEKHDVYIKLNGFYSSYSGCDWGSYTEVKPQQKTITTFE